MTALISVEDLFKQLEDKNIKIFDVTYPRGMAHPLGIPGAQIFDIDEIADPDNAMAHMLPSPELFQEKMQALGLNGNDTTVMYDQSGIAMAAARGWWMLRTFGHDNVKVLNGGLARWLAKDLPVEPFSTTPPPKGNFTAAFRPELVKSADDVLENIESQDFQVLDARNFDRFRKDGHIPGSRNLFFMELLDGETGMMLENGMLRKKIDNSGISENQPIVTSCGSGVTACVDALALYELGYKDVAVYDGSWTEWSSRDDLPKETGA